MQQEGKDTRLKIRITYIAFGLWTNLLMGGQTNTFPLWSLVVVSSESVADIIHYAAHMPYYWHLRFRSCSCQTGKVMKARPAVPRNLAPTRDWFEAARAFSFVTYESEWMNDRASASGHEVLLYRSVRNMFSGSWTVGCPCVSIHVPVSCF
jgi:hypothetical protein